MLFTFCFLPIALLPFPVARMITQHWRRREEWRGGGGGGVCVCYWKKSTGSELEWAAGSHEHWCTHMSFVLCRSAVDTLSSSPSLLVDDLNINVLYLLMACLVFGIGINLSYFSPQHLYTALYVIDRLTFLLTGSITVFTAEYRALTSTSPATK